MAILTISDLDDRLADQLRIRAVRHGRSIEDEVCEILRVALSTSDEGPAHLVDRIRAHVAQFGSFDPSEVPREPIPGPVDLSSG